jgi:methylated-DNA-[protein]-cysteine S-methyltransferase
MMIKTAHYLSPIGCLEITGGKQGIKSVQLKKDAPCPGTPVPGELTDAVKQLAEYFSGKRKEFDLPLDLSSGTEFYQSVWKELLKIPYGHTTTYSAIAGKVGHPVAVRAVGLANRNNPLAIIVPCHRVIAKSGDLQGYFYGLDVKRKLLQLENPMSFGEQGSLF